jgi:hypothetical protein
MLDIVLHNCTAVKTLSLSLSLSLYLILSLSVLRACTDIKKVAKIILVGRALIKRATIYRVSIKSLPVFER